MELARNGACEILHRHVTQTVAHKEHHVAREHLDEKARDPAVRHVGAAVVGIHEDELVGVRHVTVQVDDAIEVVAKRQGGRGERAHGHPQRLRRSLEAKVVVGGHKTQHAALKEPEDVRMQVGRCASAHDLRARLLELPCLAHAAQIGLVALIANALWCRLAGMHDPRDVLDQLREVGQGVGRLHGDARAGKHHEPILLDRFRQPIRYLHSLNPHAPTHAHRSLALF